MPYAIRDKYLGIEVDIGLTKDLIPVLHHDPWVSKKDCTHTDETPIKKRHLIRDYDFATLQELFRCGQTEQSIGTPIPSLADLLQELSTHPDVILNLDIK
ncbi:MAG: glycerophosphodiester phosphodiesterase family protein, partial [Myxococcota bacterium]|nr:glycerophosphodiester phosphodiesterase family protein [Myxococcota bacterium]